jgi:hypothetical protein
MLFDGCGLAPYPRNRRGKEPAAGRHRQTDAQAHQHDPRHGCEKHKISMDWLLCGDPQGLHRMTKEAKAESPELTEAQRKEVTQLFLALSPRMQSVALALIRELLARRHL